MNKNVRLRLGYLISGLVLISSITYADESPLSLKVNGDFRYRHEMINQEGNVSRDRDRIRARLTLSSQVNKETEVVLRFASGNADPVSTNQTLSGGFSNKGIMIDQAFFSWKPSMVNGLAVYGGKIKTPFFTPGKTELLWDSDLTPEGAAVSYKRKSGKTELFTNVSYLWVEEREKEKESTLIGGQAGLKMNIPGTGILFGGGYYDYQNAKGFSPFYDATKNAGNSLKLAKYKYDYNELEFFTEVSPSIKLSPVFFANYVSNIADKVDNKTGWLLGVSLGKSKNKGDLFLRYSYRNIESDAVIGAFTDSDFIGGGTDGKGHEINLEYGIGKNVNGELSCFVNSKGIDNSIDYRRFQFDVNYNF